MTEKENYEDFLIIMQTKKFFPQLQIEKRELRHSNI